MRGVGERAWGEWEIDAHTPQRFTSVSPAFAPAPTFMHQQGGRRDIHLFQQPAG